MESGNSCLQENGCYFSGLKPNHTASVTRVLSMDRWTRAEERAAELVARIQPDQPSWQTRNAVALYVHRLITASIPCVVSIYGSVPLKTYLPDGDIDLTVFSEDSNLEDNCAAKVSKILEKAGSDADSEYQIKEVQLIPAEVKVVKCLVDDIVVDISFGQIGGLCTLAFLEQVDQLINQNHLFKRSIILIKAWCYYESRLLGAHHGLLSTYALETLILYIFHVFNNSFAGPLEVLYRFLEFFSSFDWDNFCISLQGPVPIRALPDMTADPPRKDGGAVFLSNMYFETFKYCYSVRPSTPEIQQSFTSKHLNIIDFLRVNNNLGRSVGRGNFFRIRSAFTFGAKRLGAILDCPLESVAAEFDRFFHTTWEMNGRVLRPDTSGFGNLCQMEKGGELDDPAIIYADNCFTMHKEDSSESRLFCSEYTEKKQKPASAPKVACCHTEERKPYELIIENGDLVGRCGGKREILCSSFTNSMLKDVSPRMSIEPLDDSIRKAPTTDHKSVIDYTHWQTLGAGNVLKIFFRDGKEVSRSWSTKKTALPTEASLTCGAGSTFSTAEKPNDILDGDPSRHLYNILHARACQVSKTTPAKDPIILPEPAVIMPSSTSHANHWPSCMKTEKISSWKQKGKNYCNHTKGVIKEREVDTKPQADAAGLSQHQVYNSSQWIPLAAKPKRYIQAQHCIQP